MFSEDFYEDGRHFSYDTFLREFQLIWEAVQPILKIRDIRRIGFYAEHRFEAKAHPSVQLFEAITKLPRSPIVDKFSMQFEVRKPTGKGGLPDPVKDDFYNYITSIYDSSIDTEHPEVGFFNANLDVQRYYSPALNGDVPGAARAIAQEYQKAEPSFFEHLESLGLKHAKTT